MYVIECPSYWSCTTACCFKRLMILSIFFSKLLEISDDRNSLNKNTSLAFQKNCLFRQTALKNVKVNQFFVLFFVVLFTCCSFSGTLILASITQNMRLDFWHFSSENQNTNQIKSSQSKTIKCRIARITMSFFTDQQ